ncbi:hypothetical protein AND_007277 [Anopheles darlingi]|uniref:Protein msta n=1 Tax=Anopheles darlingi TaxID=43151 RepID=W5JCL7_ANODA|nr:hypothetical protein AND_007277 [Anopheles darlingi]
MLEDEDSDRIEKICPVCQVEATKRCSRCALVYYCSVEHQQQHWKKHKATCNPFKVFSNEQFGRFLVATREIRAGEVVIKEPPLVHGPAQITGPVCVGCLQIAIQHFYVPHPMYQCLMPLRCLLLAESDPAKWELLQQLESHEEERRGSELWRNDREGVAKLIPRFFKTGDRWDEDEILRIVGIIQVNGHEIPLSVPSSVAIYNQASMLEHSCRPNLSKSFTNRGEIVLWAPNTIKRGERLSICYTDAMWATGNRLEHLQQTKMFRCECERCSDPTEYETYFSALRCSGFQKDSKCKGYILPVDSDNWTTGDWSCQKCRGVVTGAAVGQILERARMDLEAMQKHREDHCNKYMKHYSKWLTPNHQYLVDVKISLSQVIGGKAPEAIKKIPYEKLMSKIKICQDLLTLFEKICPAEARAFGATRFELHAALAELARRSTESNNPACTSQLEESLYNANECVRMLLHEPAVLMESKICAQAKMNAEALKSLLGIKE